MRARLAIISTAILVTLVTALPGTIAHAATPPAPVTCDTTKGACWHPAVGLRWQYQLQGVATYASTGGINVNISGGARLGRRRRAARRSSTSTSTSTRR